MSRLILTIDDIPQKVTVPLVDYLAEKSIPAIFFAIGEKLEKDPAPAVHALKKGFLIGNHSFSHPFFSQITYEEAVKEIQRTEALLDKVYEEAGVEREMKFFRFPYIDKGGDKRADYQAFLRDEKFVKLDDTAVTAPGYLRDDWNKEIDTACSFDCQEYNIPAGTMTIEDVICRLREGDPGNGSSVFGEDTQIVLLHSHDDTDKLIPGYYRIILEEILRLGGEFISPKWME